MITLAIIMVITIILVEYISMRYNIKNVTYEIEPSKKIVEPDEEFELTTKIGNNKRLPVPYISVAEVLPAHINVFGKGYTMAKTQSSQRYTTKTDFNKKSDMFSTLTTFKIRDSVDNHRTMYYTSFLKSKSILIRKLDASLPKRGRYFFKGASISAGDFLGFDESIEYFEVLKEIVVLPKRLDCQKLNDTLGGFLGQVSVNRFIMEDPIMTLGYREYTGREPQKAISWTQSAKTNRLMVKKYDYTVESNVNIILNVENGRHEELETCFSLARTICEELEKKGIKYGFTTNATAEGFISIWGKANEGLGQAHLNTILEGLGRAGYDCGENFEYTLERCMRQSEISTAYIIITAQTSHNFDVIIKRFSSMVSKDVKVFSALEVMEWK